MLKILIAAGALASLSIPAIAGSYSVTGQNGGTATGTTDCTRVGETIVCNGTGTWVGNQGRERDRDATRLFTDGTVSGSKTVTGVGGRERTVEWSRDRRITPRRN